MNGSVYMVWLIIFNHISYIYMKTLTHTNTPCTYLFNCIYIQSWPKISAPLVNLFGRVSRKIILALPKTNSSIFSCQTRLELQMELASMVRWKSQDGFGAHRDKKYPMCTMKYTAVYLSLEWFWMKEWSLISCQVFSNLIRHYRINFRAVKLANKQRFQKALKKGLIVSNVY